jgi:hypothetical protein
VATFTIDSFKHWQWAANSVYYLLSLWSRLVASMPYLKGDVPSQLESYVPQVRFEIPQGRGKGAHEGRKQKDVPSQLESYVPQIELQ